MISFPIFHLPNEQDKNELQLLNSKGEVYVYDCLSPLSASSGVNIEQQKMLSLQSCVDYCLDNEEDLFLFITDCYAKILDFDIEEVIKGIEVPLVRGIDLLLLNATIVEDLVPLSEKISWINCFFGSTIMVFFRPSFSKIKNYAAVNENSFETNLFELLNRKILFHEQISPPSLPKLKMEQYGKQDFEELLQITALQIQLYKNVYLHYTGFNECDSAMAEDKAKFIHKYSRYVVLKERFISCFL